MTEASQPSPTPPTLAESATNEWLWLLGSGAAYGLLMRFAMGLWPFSHGLGGGAMLASFLLLVPFLIGLWTIGRLPPERRSIVTAITLPWAPMLIFVAGTALLAIEGSICIAMALPLFMIMASLGGVLAHIAVRTKIALGTTRAFLALPLLAGAWEQSLPTPDAYEESRASIHVEAPPPRIWQLINNATEIQPAEMAQGWAYRIGVPYPVEAITAQTPEGRVRRLRWQGGVHFDEPILDWDENRYVRWSYRFDADSIPPDALDEHVRIGGRHFDLVDTS